MRKDNLLKLADYLENNVSQAQFDMQTYRKHSSGVPARYNRLGVGCGTVGCSLGWAPFVKGLEPVESDFMDDGSVLDFVAYEERVFGIRAEHNPEHRWSWLFNSVWKYVDNTPKGAAKRIRYLVEYGKPPRDYMFQMRGEAPYIFAEEG